MCVVTIDSSTKSVNQDNCKIVSAVSSNDGINKETVRSRIKSNFKALSTRYCDAIGDKEARSQGYDPDAPRPDGRKGLSVYPRQEDRRLQGISAHEGVVHGDTRAL